MTDERNDLPSPTATNFEQRVRETLMTYMGRQGNPLDRGLTVRDLMESGLVEVKPGMSLQPGQRVLPIKAGPAAGGTYIPDLTPPPTPTGFAVNAGMAYIMVEHAPATFTQGGGYLRAVLYGKIRNGGEAPPVFADAVKLTEFTGSPGSMPSEPATTWHLWIKWETNDGVLSADPAGGTNGLSATTGQDVSKLLEALTGEITASQLYGDLSKRIDLVDGPNTLVGSVAARLRDETEKGTQALSAASKTLRDESDALAAALRGEADTLSEDFAEAMGLEAAARVLAFTDEAKARNDALFDQAKVLGAAITKVDETQQSDTESFARTITTLTGSLDDAVGAIATESAIRVEAERLIGVDISTIAGRVGSTEGWITKKELLDITKDAATADLFKGIGLTINDPLTGLPATRSLLIDSYSTTITAKEYVGTKITEMKGELTNAQTGIIASAISSDKIFSKIDANSATSTKITEFGTELRHPTTGLIANAISTNTIFSQTDAKLAMTSAVQLLRAEFTGPEGATSVADYTNKIVAKSDPKGAAATAVKALKAELLAPTDGSAPLLLSKADIERTYTTTANKNAAEALAATAVKAAFEDPATGLVAKAINESTIYNKSDADGAISTEIKRVFSKYVDPTTQSVSTAKMETELFASTTATDAIVTEIKKIGAAFIDPASGKMTTATIENAILTSTTATAAYATAITNYKSATTGKSISNIEVAATTAASDTDKLKTQYAVKMESVGPNGVVAAAGFGLALEPNGTTGAMTSQFLVKADRFAVVATYTESYIAGYQTISSGGGGGGWGGGGGSSYQVPVYATREVTSPKAPFIVQTVDTVTNGVAVPAGVYMDSAYIKNGTITNAKIGVATIDSANIASLDATLLTAGDGTIGNTLKSENYSATAGWRIERNGNAVFNNATVRGTVVANAGNIGGNLITSDAIQSPAFAGSATGFQLKSDGSLFVGAASNFLRYDAPTQKLTYRGSLDVKSSTSTSESRMEISDHCIKVYEGTVLRVHIGDLSK